MAAMDIPQVLEILAPGRDWGPSANTSNTYAELAAGWRDPTPIPTQAAMLAKWAELESTAEARRIAALRALAKTLAAAPDSHIATIVRAVALAAGDGDNVLRGWIAGHLADISAAVSLADLKARVALRGSPPSLTPAQVKSAVAARVDTPDADS